MILMTSLRENKFQKQCTDFLKERKIYHVNVHGSSWTGRGTPDLLTSINGRFVAFELKVKGNTLEPAQEIHRSRIEDSGGLHYAPYTLEEFKLILKRLGVD